MGQHSTSKDTLHRNLISLLERGCVPWRHRWKASALGERHLNLFSGTAYGGADPLLLEVARVHRRAPLPWWCTYGEAKAAGLVPRKGAVGVHLGLAEPLGGCRKRLPVVFNAADLVGPAFQRTLARRRRALATESPSNHERLHRAEQWIRAWPAPIREGRPLPQYQLRQDQGVLPSRHNVPCREAFLATWAQEQLRSTEQAECLASWDGAQGTQPEIREFILELAWILLAERLGLGREYGWFVLAESDWMGRLQPSPQTFIELLVEARKVVDLLAPAATKVRGSADKLPALV